MYDVIISKVLSNPRIDKRTLLQKFISKIELESNLNENLSSELSQIKGLMNSSKEVIEDGSAEAVPHLNNSKNHAASQHEPAAPQLLEAAQKARNDGA